jgi:hypothetical protein
MKQLAVEALFFAIGEYLLLSEAATSSGLSIWMRSVFSFQKPYPHCHYDLLPRVVEAIVPPAAPLSTTGEQFYYFVGIMLDEFQEVFPPSAAGDVITILMARISRLDPSALDVFRPLSQFLSRDDNLNVCSFFANSLVAVVHARPPFLAVDTPGERVAMQLGPVAAPESVLRF